MAKSRIVVLKLKDICIIVAITLALFIAIIVLIEYNSGKNNSISTVNELENECSYTPGSYSCQLSIGSKILDMTITLDDNHINDICFDNLDNETKASYPLLEPTLQNIAIQLKSGTSIDEIIISNESAYTGKMLLETIKKTLDKAKI